MALQSVDGTNDKKRIILYALSTCIWCGKTKKLLKELNVKFDYIDVDLLEAAERQEVMKTIAEVNPQGGFPTMVIDGNKVIVGYQPESIKAQAL